MTTPRLDPDRLSIIGDCMDSYGLGEPDADWPANIVSRRAVAYHDGSIVLAGTPVTHMVDEAEVALCERLSAEAAALMHGVSVGMGSDADVPFRAFSIATPQEGAGPSSLNERAIQDFFGEVLFPAARITVEPLTQGTTWWEEVEEDGAGSAHSYFAPWRAMASWFRSQPAFKDTAFVRVGSARELGLLPKVSYPRGTVLPGCNLPRLAVGLTHRGSLAGLFGYVVQS